MNIVQFSPIRNGHGAKKPACQDRLVIIYVIRLDSGQPFGRLFIAEDLCLQPLLRTVQSAEKRDASPFSPADSSDSAIAPISSSLIPSGS